MKTFFLIILVLFLAERLFHYVLTWLNLNHMKKHRELPVEFEGVLDLAALEKSRNYLFANTSYGIVSGIFNDLLVGLFMFAGLLNLYSGWIDSLNLPFILSGVLFVLVLMLAETVLSIPFDLFHTFKIEKEFGFNKMTSRLWLADFFKNLLLQLILIGALFSAGLFIIQKSADFWWFFLWIFYFLFTLFMLYISPYVIEPLFNKFTPVEDEELNTKLKAMLSKTGIKVSRVFKMDASKRSTHTNAYFSGIGHVKRIVLFDTLLEKLTHDEILGVLAHEAGHWKKKHLLKTLVVMEIASLVMFYAVYQLIRTSYLTQIFNTENASFFLRTAQAFFTLSLVLFAAGPLSAFFSRKNENEADRFAVGLTGSGAGLSGALRKLTRDNLSNLFPHPLYTAFYYSHPPVLERLKRIGRNHE